jgi:hypothetical protein
MPQYPVKPEGDLFEALKETLTGDHAEGRYSRGVLGEDAQILDEAREVGALLGKNIPNQVGQLAQALKRTKANVGILKKRGWDKHLGRAASRELNEINEVLSKAVSALHRAAELSEKVARDAHKLSPSK